MSYQVLARKWRPQLFEEVVGQEAITQTLRNAIEYDRLHHAYLFSGARGVGKTTTARLLAKALNCNKTSTPNKTPCDTSKDNACDSCREIAESRSLDVFEFDAASHTGVDDIREIILESINVNPARDRFKVFIIDEVHMLSKSSFNALLKTLEEPPPKVVFIMATTELHKVPDTILSRCQAFEFRTISLEKIHDRLKAIAEVEKIDISEDGLREIARSGEGSMRDAQSNLDQVISFSGEKIGIEDVLNALGIASSENLTRVIAAIENKDPAELFDVVDDLVGRGHDLRNFCRDLLRFIRDILVAKITDGDDDTFDSAIVGSKQLKGLASHFSESDLIRFFNSIAETEAKLPDASEPRYLLEIGLVKLIEMRRIKSIEDILERLINLESASGTIDTTDPQAQNPDYSDRSASQIAESVDIPEKKTLAPENSPVRRPPPRDDSLPPIKASKTNRESPKEKESDLEEINQEIDNDKESTQPPAVKVKSLNINPDLMPVKLPPIDSEDLDHVEDKRLDDEFEKTLAREGDDLRNIKNASGIVAALLNKHQEVEPQRGIKTSDTNGNAAVATALSKENKALDIVSELAAVGQIDETVPVLPEDPTDDEMWQYAENHPLVKKVKRIFRGKLVKVERKTE